MAKRYSEEQKEQYVEQAIQFLQSGMSVRNAAKKLRIPLGRLSLWLQEEHPSLVVFKSQLISPWDVETRKLRSGEIPIPESMMALIEELESTDRTLYELAEDAEIEPHDLLYYLYHYDPLLLDKVMHRYSYNQGRFTTPIHRHKHSFHGQALQELVAGNYPQRRRGYFQRRKHHADGGRHERIGGPNLEETRVGSSLWEEPAAPEPKPPKSLTRWKSVLFPPRRAKTGIPMEFQEAFEERLKQLCQNSELSQTQMIRMLQEEFGVKVSQPFVSSFCRRLGFTRMVGRKRGPNIKLTDFIRARIHELCQQADVTYDQMVVMLHTEFGVKLHRSQVAALCKGYGFKRTRGRKKGISPHRAPSRFH